MKTITGDQVSAVAREALDAGEGLLRLAPNWVPRSFLHPGKRIKLHPHDWYAYGAHRGGIDERWFGSTTDAANERYEQLQIYRLADAENPAPTELIHATGMDPVLKANPTPPSRPSSTTPPRPPIRPSISRTARQQASCADSFLARSTARLASPTRRMSSPQPVHAAPATRSSA